MRRKQTTSCGHEGLLREVGVERRDSAEALSISPASERRRNDMQEGHTLCMLILLNRRIPNGTYGGVGGRGLTTPSYPIARHER